jgi:hypothetical protein
MSTLLKLKPDPTFKSKVEIPRPGGGVTVVEFVFIYRSRKELDAWLQPSGQAESGAAAALPDDVERILSMAKGWDLSDEFGRPALEELVEILQRAPKAILDRYIAELTGVRLGN